MLKYSKIKSPIFLVDAKKVENNINKMLSTLPDNCTLRPHFKTHNNKITAGIFKKLGINKITVSSVEMALYFRNLGFRDITIAFPVNIREYKNLNKLSHKTTIGLTFTSSNAVDFISKCKNIYADAWIEIDTGYNRSGIEYNKYNQINEIINKIIKSENLKFKGFLTHSGQTYKCNSLKEIVQVSKESYDIMINLKKYFSEFSPLISVGDTPSCSVYHNFQDIDEIRPGNFVYFDLMMWKLGVCKLEDIAVKVVCPVVDVHPERNEIVIHAGSVNLGKEFITTKDNLVFGKVINHISENSINQIDEQVINLSQEHGIVKLLNYKTKNIKIGDLVEIIPVHSCLTANYMKNKTKHIF